jgi:hypothetical protein
MIAGCAPSDSLSKHDANQTAPQLVAKINTQEKYNNPEATLPKTSHDSLNMARKKLQDMIKNKRCDTATQCKVIAVGSRACGGPSSYETFSTQSANVVAVEKLVNSITVLESQFNAKNNMISICEHLSQPSTQCVENKCVKIQGNAQFAY